MAKQGWDDEGSEEDETAAGLRAVYEAVSLAIIECIEQVEQLRESERYAVMQFCRDNPDGFDSIVARRRDFLAKEIDTLEQEAQQLQIEIGELSGKTWDTQ